MYKRQGETIGIIGGTGSSKSTLIQFISRLYDATEGSVRVGGVDVRSYDLEALRDQVAVVLQKNVLFSGSIPVSYTHLDVYKRQANSFARSLPVRTSCGWRWAGETARS